MNDNNNSFSESTEELVAYIDGELDDSQRIAVEARLDQDADFRAEYESLCQSWKMLDYLPTTNSNEDFTRTTIAMATVSLAEERTIAQRRARARTWKRRLLAASGWSAVAAAAFFVVARPSWQNESKRLHDIPVIESMDAYMYGESVEFLRELHRANLFAENEGTDDY